MCHLKYPRNTPERLLILDLRNYRQLCFDIRYFQVAAECIIPQEVRQHNLHGDHSVFCANAIPLPTAKAQESVRMLVLHILSRKMLWIEFIGARSPIALQPMDFVHIEHDDRALGNDVGADFDFGRCQAPHHRCWRQNPHRLLHFLIKAKVQSSYTLAFTIITIPIYLDYHFAVLHAHAVVECDRCIGAGENFV